MWFRMIKIPNENLLRQSCCAWAFGVFLQLTGVCLRKFPCQTNEGRVENFIMAWMCSLKCAMDCGNKGGNIPNSFWQNDYIRHFDLVHISLTARKYADELVAKCRLVLSQLHLFQLFKQRRWQMRISYHSLFLPSIFHISCTGKIEVNKFLAKPSVMTTMMIMIMRTEDGNILYISRRGYHV